MMDLPDTPQTPEAALVTAILMQAYRDMFLMVTDESGATFTSRSERDQAMTFLTERTGAMARRRNTFCSLIGWDGDVLAASVRAMMDGAPFPHPSLDPTSATLARHAIAVERLRERWHALQAPRPRAAA